MKSPEDAQLQSPRQVESKSPADGPGNSGEFEIPARRIARTTHHAALLAIGTGKKSFPAADLCYGSFE
jgi:hypothetical protein